jgi:hypothetical protein
MSRHSQPYAKFRADQSAALRQHSAAVLKARAMGPVKGLTPSRVTASGGTTDTGAGSSAPPPDPTYEAARAAAGRNIQIGDAEAAYQHAALSNEYGIGDASNPYSKAALLQNSYNQAKLATTNSLAAQGQLYSGAMVNAQGTNDRNYSINNDALLRAYQAAQHNVTLGQANSYATNAIGTSDQAFAALLRSLGGG